MHTKEPPERRLEMPRPIASYFEASNRQDVEAMLSNFAEDAVVLDEGRERRGPSELRDWMTGTTTRYAATAVPLDASTTGSGTTVVCRVSGAFPGSPLDLRFSFRVARQRITRLEITP